MNRSNFRQIFNCRGPAVLPVIHVQNETQTLLNVRIATENGAHGVFLINHDFHHDLMPDIIETVRRAHPDTWLGVNFLGVAGQAAFPILGELQNEGTQVNAYWADDACIEETATKQIAADSIAKARHASGWNGLYFGGTAFKKQRNVDPEHFAQAATIATKYMDVVTTSGVATGHAADIQKIEVFRRACGDHPLALASGITPENVHKYAHSLDAILVATGINFPSDFYNIDPERLQLLIANIPT